VLYRTGPVTASVWEAGMFVRSSSDVVSPDIQMHCLPAFVVDHGRMRIRGHGMTINTCNLRPNSVGSATLGSAGAAVPPAIDPNYFDRSRDPAVLSKMRPTRGRRYNSRTRRLLTG
jgi:choline dehydrogenase